MIKSLIKALPFLLLFILSASLVHATTVTGKFTDPALNPVSGTVTFTLSIPGGRTAVQISTPRQILPVPIVNTLDGTGAISGTLTLVGNDDVNPTDTYYAVVVRDKNGISLGTQNVYITGASADLGTVQYVSVLPTVPTFSGAVLLSPTGAANQTVNGPLTATGLVTANAGVMSSGPDTLNAKYLNNIRFADQFPGADWIAKINAADADLGPTAGEIWINQNANGGTATTALTLSANHTIRFVQGGTYSYHVTLPITNVNDSIECSNGTALNYTGAAENLLIGPGTGSITVLSTVIHGCTFTATSASNGIRLKDAANVQLLGNVVSGTGYTQADLMLDSTVTTGGNIRLNIENNQFISSGGTTTAGIYAGGSANQENQILIKGNTIQGHQGLGVNFNETSENLDIIGNDIEGNTAGNVQIFNSLPCVISGNYMQFSVGAGAIYDIGFEKLKGGGASQCTITGNLILTSGGASQKAIVAWGLSNAGLLNIEGNYISEGSAAGAVGIDVGITNARIGPNFFPAGGTLDVGNNEAGATEGPVTRTGFGTPVQIYAARASIGATNLYTNAYAGDYRVCYNARTWVGGGTGTTATVGITWTDDGGAKTFTSPTFALNAVDVTGQVNGCQVIHVKVGTTVQVLTTVAAIGTSLYSFSATIEQIQ